MLNQSRVDQVFHALGDPTRRAIVERLSEGSTSVSGLAVPLGVTLAAVVQHLQILEACALIRTEKVGRVRHCHLNHDGLRVAEQWIAARRAAWERCFDQLGQVLDESAEAAPEDNKAKDES